MVSEKRLLSELLQLYKHHPCLWDSREFVYTNKEARDQAYEVLLEKYNEICEDANIVDLKRKIEHMRAAYRREHKKVLLSRSKGGGKEYLPTLWYYDLMTFLNDVCDFSRFELLPKKRDEDTNTKDDEELKPRKRIKKRDVTAPSTIYLPEQSSYHSSDEHALDNPEEHDIIDNGDEHFVQKSDEIDITSTIKQEVDNAPTVPILEDAERDGLQESESFGTTVGLQLKNLDPVQRMIAEKLISDVIFDARFHKLTVSSKIIHH